MVEGDARAVCFKGDVQVIVFVECQDGSGVEGAFEDSRRIAAPQQREVCHVVCSLCDEVGGEGYYYTYTATKAGTLTLTFETDTIATYSINNKIFRYTNKSGHESYRLNVREGQVTTIMVNTYDPKKPNENPKGTVTFEVTLQ
jgi:hypothetical protein